MPVAKVFFFFFSEGKEIEQYVAQQEECAKCAPDIAMKFQHLVSSKNIAFRDVTPFFKVAKVVEGIVSKVILIRPRRWGKSVLGTAWVEFLRGREDLFVATYVKDKMRKEKFIGVHLDLSDAVTLARCLDRIANAINKGLAEAEKVIGYKESAKGRRVLKNREDLPSNTDNWSSADFATVAVRFLDQLASISEVAEQKVALFIDEYDRPCISALNKEQIIFDGFSEFFQTLFTSIKERESIQFLFVTGSSRLAIKGFFSGGNDITVKKTRLSITSQI